MERLNAGRTKSASDVRSECSIMVMNSSSSRAFAMKKCRGGFAVRCADVMIKIYVIDTW